MTRPKRIRRVSFAIAGIALAAAIHSYDGNPPLADEVAVIAAPLGLPPVPFPERNPPTPDKIALGRRLFGDQRLSADGTMSCASCHDPARAFKAERPVASHRGAADERLRRNIPSLLNVAYATHLHHDGLEPTLEVQTLAPLFNAAEMANKTFDDLAGRLAAIAEYREAFTKVFGSSPTIETLGDAIASYERSLIAGDSPFDRWKYGRDEAAVTPEAKAGFALFAGKARCASCHVAGLRDAIFTTNAFVNTGIGFAAETRRVTDGSHALSDRGREEVTHAREDRYRFRIPTLRNVALTAPYMHDGSLPTLEAVVSYYNGGGSADPEKDERIRPLGLNAREMKQLLAFLRSLTSSTVPAHETTSSAP